jgi:glycosyltransferase involved in cell wall biosynthesis
VFPVQEYSGSIEFPLTVLEAMACDRPVVSTAFRGLPDFLAEGEALRYFDGFDALVAALDQVCGVRGNRERIRDFSWESVAHRLLAGAGEGAGA